MVSTEGIVGRLMGDCGSADIYREYINPKATNKQLLWVSRVSLFAFCLVQVCPSPSALNSRAFTSIFKLDGRTSQLCYPSAKGVVQVSLRRCLLTGGSAVGTNTP